MKNHGSTSIPVSRSDSIRQRPKQNGVGSNIDAVLSEILALMSITKRDYWGIELVDHTQEATNPAADSPDTRPVDDRLPPDHQLANKPCSRAALGVAVGNQVIRVQAAFGVVGSVPCFLFRRGVFETAHVGPSTIRVSGELTPANAPGVLQLELWRHGRDTFAHAS